jgi:hypothetical protein
MRFAATVYGKVLAEFLISEGWHYGQVQKL